MNPRLNVSRRASSRTAAAVLAIAGAAILAPGVHAQEPGASGSGPGRYAMHQTDGGFVRLDTQTGAVAFCRKQGDSWGCRTVAGAGGGDSADQGETSELERLKRENAELREEVARLEELLGLREPGAGEGGQRHSFKLPSEQDVDKAFDYFERMLRKFQDRLKKLEPDTEAAPERQL